MSVIHGGTENEIHRENWNIRRIRRIRVRHEVDFHVRWKPVVQGKCRQARKAMPRFRTEPKMKLLRFIFRLFTLIRFRSREHTPQTMDMMIRQAIIEKRLLAFDYGGHRRIAEPHTYGMKNEGGQLLVYQVGGQSSSGGLPEWRRMKMDGMTNMTVLKDTFPGKRDVMGLHSSWDVIYLIVS